MDAERHVLEKGLYLCASLAAASIRAHFLTQPAEAARIVMENQLKHDFRTWVKDQQRDDGQARKQGRLMRD